MGMLKSASKVGESESEGPQKGVAAVDRALSILVALEADPNPRSLADLARDTGLYKSTILRLMDSLQAAGYVMRQDDTGYALGPTLYRLGMAYERRNPLRNHVIPVLKRLVAAGTESASFHVRQDAEHRTCLYRVDSDHATLDRVHAGDLLPMSKGAAGRVLSAFSGTPGRPYATIRKEHFALSLGERDPSCAGMAAPVFGPDGDLVGALSLSGPRERFTDAQVKKMCPLLIDAAKELTLSLGGPIWPPAAAPDR